LDKTNQIKAIFYFFDLLSPGIKPLKAYFNWFRANYEMKRQTDIIRSKPLKITFDPTNMCHLKCPLCPTGLGIINWDPKHANLKMFRRLLDEVGDYLFFIDFYNWGEPLLNPRIEDYISLANKMKISTTLSSNLSMNLTDERIEKIIKSGVNHIIASIDGASKESYSNYRRGGDFDLAINNLRRFVNRRNELGSKTPYITWQYLIFSFNEHEIDKAQVMARDIKVDRIWFNKAYLDESYYTMTDEDRSLIRKWIPLNPAFTFYDPDLRDKDNSFPLIEKTDTRLKRCDWLYMSSTINADGTVAPCCGVYKKEDILGSIGEEGEISYMDAINNENFKGIRAGFAGRSDFPEGLTCSECSDSVLMSYSKGINRWIVFTTFVKISNLFLKPIRRIFFKNGDIERPGLRVKWPD